MDTYSDHPPHVGETLEEYARRLEALGAEEMLIHKALRNHFDMPISGMAEFFEAYEDARLRHIDLLWRIHPNRTRYSMVKKVAKNLGISEDTAEAWVAKHEKKND